MGELMLHKKRNVKCLTTILISLIIIIEINPLFYSVLAQSSIESITEISSSGTIIYTNSTGDPIIPIIFPPILPSTNTYSLTTATSGQGSVELSSNGSYIDGSIVTLTAIPTSGWEFIGWSGALSGYNSNPASLVMSQDRWVQAIFTEITLVQYSLTAVTEGQGIIELSSNGPYIDGTTVTLTAVPSSCWLFSGWEGALSGYNGNPVSLVMSEDRWVQATFTEVTSDQYSLTTNTEGQGTISLSSQGPYEDGEIISLTAVSSPGWGFTGWSGALLTSGTTNPASLVMSQDRWVQATFTETSEMYSITTAISGQGSVEPSSPGPYEDGTILTLTAVPNSGWIFSGWGGALASSGSTNPEILIMDQNRWVMATFTEPSTEMYSLTTTVSGQGSVELSSNGPYEDGTTVTLTAVPTSGWEFIGWSGALSGYNGNPASLVMSQDRWVQATFTETLPPPSGTLGVTDHTFSIEGGSGENLIQTSSNKFSFSLKYDTSSEEKYWFMFGITADAGGKTVTYDVNVNNAVNGESNGHWPAYSFDGGNTWKYCADGDVSWYTTGNSEEHVVFKINFPTSQNTALVAATIPFRYSQLNAYARTFSSAVAHVNNYKSTDGRNTYIFYVDDGNPSGKETIWVIAGQEPSEMWGQWITFGMLEFLISGDSNARTLRDNYNWAIIPMINPDGNYNGKTQRNNHGVDLTTQWDNAMTGNAADEIQGCVNAINAYNSQGYEIKAFIDSHCFYISKWMIYCSRGGGLSLANTINAGTHYGDNGISTWSSSEKSVPAIYNRYSAAGVLIETTQWRKLLHWTVGDATVSNLKTYGKTLAKSLLYYE